MDRSRRSNQLILVTGASGYVGGRLVPALEARGARVRCLARNPSYLANRFSSRTEVVAGDVLDPDSLTAALAGVDAAYYLVHSMGSRADFEERDRLGARNFARAARERGARRVIYLGGLIGDGELSPHLASRLEVGRILASEGPPTLEFRASIIVGSGSLSFELLRSLVNRLPAMVTPRWVRTPAQPIAIDDVVAYLTHGLDLDEEGSAVFEIGGPRQVTYGELMHEYARQIGVRRVMLPVPLLSPRLSSLWLGLVTPVYARVGRKLVTSLRNETVVRDAAALERFPVRPLGVGEAIARALREEDREMARTRWSDAVSSSGGGALWGGKRFGSRIVDRQQAVVGAETARAFAPIQRIGGSRGWYFANWLWALRGAADLLVGGVGMRRGRRHPVDVRPGDPLDFWRVEAFEPDRLLRLKAEMRVPGRAWLQFEVEPTEEGSRVTQTAVFDPLGLGGLLYWYGLYPVHWLIFRGMLRGILRRAATGVGWRTCNQPTGKPAISRYPSLLRGHFMSEIEHQKLDIMTLIDRAPWREAVTFRDTWPHEYVVSKKHGQQELLAAFCARIGRGEGVTCHFFHQTRQYLFLGEYKYWTMTECADIDPDGDYVLNRALLYRDRRDFAIRHGDTGKRDD